VSDGHLKSEEHALLTWSQHLDFHDYFTAWLASATTLGSEALVPVDEAPALSSVSPVGGLPACSQRLAWHQQDLCHVASV
jgi:hypothetical protein